MNFYNDIDPYVCDWMRNLIAAGELPAGDVSNDSILDLVPADLEGYQVAHFFAGIGGWPLALKWAGWPEEVPVWTGSPPCQPFSTATPSASIYEEAKQDERHLWPTWRDLIRANRPAVVFGEQVATEASRAWLGDVLHELEVCGYWTVAAHLPACSVGAPQVRMRTWFAACLMGDSDGVQRHRLEGQDQRWRPHHWGSRGQAVHQPLGTRDDVSQLGRWHASLPALCDGGEVRPIEPGILPLAHGLPHGLDAVRAPGNAIVPQVAAVFVSCVMDTIDWAMEAPGVEPG